MGTKPDIDTAIEIKAPAARVWSILMDFPKYPEWNPFIKEISGPAEVGKNLKVKIQPEGKDPMNFTPKVLAVQPDQKLTWRGKVLLPGLLDGEHSFELVPQGDGSSCKFVHTETFSGILFSLFKNSFLGPSTSGFQKMNEALKQRAEQT